jgi:hypothetical protein
LASTLIDGGERNRQLVGIVNVAGSDDRNVSGHFEASREDRLNRTDGNWVAVTENSVWNWAHPKQSPHALISRLVSVPAGYNETCVRTQAVPLERSAVAFEAFLGDTYFGTAQVSNATASARDKMLRRQSADGEVVGPNEGCLRPSNGAVNQDIGYVSSMNPPEQFQATHGLSRSDNEPVHLPGQQGISLASFQFGIFLEIRNDDVIPLGTHSLRYSARNLGEEGMGEVRQQ